ncbi:ribulose bisphosphate carboxylase small subunit [Methylacidiphilum caldifontis]|uniref:ribulose bisphosphate carboxylase small subunit n=1 Tax=Methylacidiphilum caldifontis TaxID=2795386 RepID=UPI001A8D4E65|nr:ribulose bisphosphate carboxylase small subunit [Methylacidiphilum caldifontis]QSR88832.1 ribulose bisphosphate carboxylase small subunit [Methylacidiphilum caldifontis]
MRITQGTFSYLPDLTDEEIAAQVQYIIDNGWAVMIEYTDNPHPRHTYWDMWGMPVFDIKDPAAVMHEFNECRKAFPNRYIRISGYNRQQGYQTTMISFICHRPKEEPGFELERIEWEDRQQKYRLRPYSTDKPKGQRY